MIVLRVGGRYVCWHSHRACWYLGPRRLAERFVQPHLTSNKRLDDALENFPTARAIWERLPE